MVNSRRLPVGLLLIIAILAAAQAYKSVYWLVFYIHRKKPLLAIANWGTAIICSAITLGIVLGLLTSFEQRSRVLSRFFDLGSGWWPATFGLVILAAGAYGLLVSANYVDDNYNWLFYGAEGGIGFLILKRTFTMDD